VPSSWIAPQASRAWLTSHNVAPSKRTGWLRVRLAEPQLGVIRNELTIGLLHCFHVWHDMPKRVGIFGGVY
jgi:hypothetical protein